MTTPEASKSKEELAKYKVTHIPEVLFKELSGQLGLGEEFELRLPDRIYQIMRLDPKKDITGFPGAIGINHSDSRVRFILWKSVPKEGMSTRDPYLVLELDAGAFDTGAWAAGSGNEQEDNVMLQFPIMGTSLYNDAIPLIRLILGRSYELFNSPNCSKKRWWPGEEPRDSK